MLRLAQKVVSQVFFFSWNKKKVYDGGGEKRVFFVYFYILVWNGDITFDFIALEENKREMNFFKIKMILPLGATVVSWRVNNQEQLFVR
jgi:hypothetical protein